MSRPDASLRQLFRRATSLTLSRWRDLLVYGYAQTALATFLLAPLLSWLVLTALQHMVGDAVVNFDIAGFVASLPALLIGLVWAIGIAALALVGLGGPVLILTEAAAGRRAKLMAVAGRVARSIPRAAARGAIRLTLLVFLAFPIATLGVAVLVSFVLAPFGGLHFDQVLPDNFIDGTLVVVAVLVLGAICLFLAVRWSFCQQGFLVARESLGEALDRSTRYVKGQQARLTRLYVGGGIVHAALVALLALLLGGLHFVLLDVLKVQGVFGIDVTLALLLFFDGVILTGAVLLTTANSIALVTVAWEEAHRLAGKDLADTEPLREVDEGRAPQRARWRTALLVLGALAIGTAVTLPSVLEERASLPGQVDITAHRGYSSVAPDNTLASVQAAIEAGADYAEIDIQEAKDGTLVVVHDTHLGKLAGLDRNVYDMTGAELVEVDVGSHFSETFSDERMPTLDQMIELAKGRIKLNIELKVHGKEQRFAERAVERIRALGFRGECVITSLDAAVLQQVRTLDPDLPLGIILTAFVGNVHQMDVDFYSVNSLVATNDFIRNARRHDRDVHVWTINEPDKIRRILDRFPDNIITDYPSRVREIRDARTPEDVIQAAVRRLFSR